MLLPCKQASTLCAIGSCQEVLCFCCPDLAAHADTLEPCQQMRFLCCACSCHVTPTEEIFASACSGYISLRYANGNARLDLLILSTRARSHAGAWHQCPCDGFCKRCTSGTCSAEKFELVNRCALSAWVFMFCVRYAGSFVQQRGVLNSDNNFCGILM